jgi:hypothetical protein
MQQYKYFMLLCKEDGCHSTKYAIECLYQFFLIFGLLSQRHTGRFIWNQSINNHGKKAVNPEPNITEAAVSHICKSESTTRSILDKLNDSISRHKRGGNHSNPSSAADLQKVVKQGRKYHHFRNFTLDRLNDLDASDSYNWISKHKKNIALGIKAR